MFNYFRNILLKKGKYMLYKGKANSSFGLFLIRLSVGAMFLIAGSKKLYDVEGFIKHVKDMQVLPENLAFIFGFILPFAEVILGSLLIIGLFTPITSFFLSVLTICIIVSTGILPSLGVPFDYNYIILACTIAIFFSGAGGLSFDALLEEKKTPKPQPKPVNEVKEMKPVEIIEPVEVDLKNDEKKDTNI
jgi:uncharacterized membrane protein YphA (DoxX/SURF4 family)